MPPDRPCLDPSRFLVSTTQADLPLRLASFSLFRLTAAFFIASIAQLAFACSPTKSPEYAPFSCVITGPPDPARLRLFPVGFIQAQPLFLGLFKITL